MRGIYLPQVKLVLQTNYLMMYGAYNISFVNQNAVDQCHI
jgi:hypothetical protein